MSLDRPDRLAGLIFATPIWTLMFSIQLWHRAQQPRTAGEPALGTVV